MPLNKSTHTLTIYIHSERARERAHADSLLTHLLLLSGNEHLSASLSLVSSQRTSKQDDVHHTLIAFHGAGSQSHTRLECIDGVCKFACSRRKFSPGAAFFLLCARGGTLKVNSPREGERKRYIFSRKMLLSKFQQRVVRVNNLHLSQRKETPFERETLAQNKRTISLVHAWLFFFWCVWCAPSVYWEHHGECGWPRALCLPLQVICKDLLHVTPSMYNPSRCHISATLFTHGCKISEQKPPLECLSLYQITSYFRCRWWRQILSLSLFLYICVRIMYRDNTLSLNWISSLMQPASHLCTLVA